MEVSALKVYPWGLLASKVEISFWQPLPPFADSTQKSQLQPFHRLDNRYRITCAVIHSSSEGMQGAKNPVESCESPGPGRKYGSRYNRRPRELETDHGQLSLSSGSAFSNVPKTFGQRE